MGKLLPRKGSGLLGVSPDRGPVCTWPLVLWVTMGVCCCSEGLRLTPACDADQCPCGDGGLSVLWAERPVCGMVSRPACAAGRHPAGDVTYKDKFQVGGPGLPGGGLQAPRARVHSELSVAARQGGRFRVFTGVFVSSRWSSTEKRGLESRDGQETIKLPPLTEERVLGPLAGEDLPAGQKTAGGGRGRGLLEG